MFSAWLSTLTEAAPAVAEHVYKQTALTGLSLPAKGLVTTVLGLGGVFLVLLLFFFAIKMMQRFGKKDATHE